MIMSTSWFPSCKECHIEIILLEKLNLECESYSLAIYMCDVKMRWKCFEVIDRSTSKTYTSHLKKRWNAGVQTTQYKSNDILRYGTVSKEQ